jgi:hypothetical protein
MFKHMGNNLSLGFDFIISHVFYFLITFNIIFDHSINVPSFVGLAYQGKDIVFRFIIENSVA